ncbi:hypothetical protein [Massilia horti]|uniref:Uncharacterized protein n=1 Tax=Massilia horti TaxID=2562153 RepID=A0A4Y9SPD5_9BURK|nr:hypothetical protein [Massilia horti]TFW28580.1 hypothetical protein E4O92_20880 [Massilia horti]
MTNIDSRMFGRSWWMQPLAARYASIDAHNAGLTVQVEIAPRPQHKDEAPCITWRGTAEQFLRTKSFPKGVSAKRASGKYFHPDQLRGTVYPDGDDRFVFVIEFCNYHGNKYPKRLVEQALKDEAYLAFRNVVLAGYPLTEDSTGAT